MESRQTQQRCSGRSGKKKRGLTVNSASPYAYNKIIDFMEKECLSYSSAGTVVFLLN